MRTRKVAVYAIVRIDRYFKTPEEQIAVQAVLPSLEEAKAEVARLNAMRDPDRVTYLWRATRLYPDGREGLGRTGGETTDA